MPLHMRDALPSASFVGFTGTPIELKNANTRAVFGDYISIYDQAQGAQPSRVGELLEQRPQHRCAQCQTASCQSKAPAGGGVWRAHNTQAEKTP